MPALAARCPTCGTTFRVVPDQLRLAEGWVRCGRCGEVFDAVGGAEDGPGEAAGGEAPASAEPGAGALEASAPSSEVPAAAASPGDDATAAGAVPSPSTGDDHHAAAPTEVGGAEPAWVGLKRPSLDQAADAEETDPAATAAPADRLVPFIVPQELPQALRPGHAPAPTSDFAPLAHPSADDDDATAAEPLPDDDDAVEDEPEAVGEAAPAAPPFAETVAADALAAEPSADDTPPFARAPAADPRWQRPGVRAALTAAVALLALALPLQAALHWRDEWAAARPRTRPALEALCGIFGCRVEPLRRIASLVIESSALTDAPSGRALRLMVTLRNRGALPVALPWVDLTLTEVNGGVIARRALAPAELGATSDTLAPGAEALLAATLALDRAGRPPSGYTVEIFHP